MFILTLPIFRPMSMSFFSVTTIAYFLLLIASFIYVVLDTIKFQIKLSPIIYSLILMEGLTFIATVINAGSLISAVNNAVGLVYVAFLINWCIRKENVFSVIHCMMVHLELCTYINFITLILRPDGFFSRTIAGYGKTHEWFLGSNHYFIIWAIPSFLIAWIYKEYTGEKKRSFLLIFVTAIPLSSLTKVGIYSILILPGQNNL